MSSLRVRTKNKLMMALGAAKPSTNMAFNLAYSDFLSTLQRLETLELTLKSYAASIKTFHAAASLVVGAIDGLSSGGSDTASYHPPKSVDSSNMQQFAGDARVAFTDVDMIVLRETYALLEHEVLTPVKAWLQHARSLQNKATTCEEQKALYDHYSRKVMALREAREKRVSTGRSGKPKHTKRMLRNEQKLAATTQEYLQQSDTVIRNLRAFVVSRDAALAALLRRVLRGRAIYAERMHEATGHISALIEDSVAKGETDGMLDHYMTIVQGGNHDGFAAIRTDDTASLFSDDNTVPKSLFHVYMGKTPSYASDHDRTFTNSASSPALSSVAMASTPSLMPYHTTRTSWNAFMTPSAPAVDSFTRKEWSASKESSSSQFVAVPDFRDMHRNALRGDTSLFR
ncbi:unnamed protein product [Peronospora belbahrii]|uniref:BAR domain-containing protein n=1 Tax=Peronospora belbahrii TaxID=622444 RepID=A0AAU9LR54_9STRA|nr:unnamed protein product [Peronospora belbahrii]CAH0522476.1 unnamed protein product [Peronospora belbahrii]